MAARPLPDPETLRKLLRYEPETGKLYWRERVAGMIEGGKHLQSTARCAAWNRRYAGTEALTAVEKDGYLMGNVLMRRVKAHRVAWAIHHGAWPPQEIDHINGNPADNRIGNLRLADDYQNAHNQRRRKNNQSGFKGVSWDAEKGRWLARKFVCGKALYLGRYDTAEEAHRAYCRATKAYCGDFGRTA